MRAVSTAAGSVAVLVAGAGLAGWMLDIATWKSVFPGSATMKPNTAFALTLCGLALVLLSREKIARGIRVGVTMLAVAVFALGALTMGEYLSGFDFGIDQLLLREPVLSINTSHAGRMAPSTALCLMLIGIALLVASQPLPKRARLPFLVAMGVSAVVIGSFAAAGYLADFLMNYRLWSYTGMALNTAGAFVLLGCGLLALARSEGGLSWSLDPWTTGGFAAAIVLLLAAVSIAYHFTSELQQTATLLSHRQEALKEIEGVSADVTNLMSGQRGYIITGDERLLEGHQQAKAATRRHIGEIRKLAADNPDQQHRLDELEQRVIQYVEWDERTISARREQGLPAAARMVATGTGVELWSSMRRRLESMRDEEYALLASDQKRAAIASTSAFLLLPVGVFLSVSLLLAGLLFLNAGVGGHVRTEAALRESETRKSAVMESAMDCIITADEEGRITEFNPAAQRTFGYTAGEVVGRELAEAIIPPAFRERHRRGLARYLATGEGSVIGRRIEITAMRADGAEFPTELAIQSTRLQGRTMFTAYLRDITERIRAENELKASIKEVVDLKSALDEHAIVATTDPRGKITYVNDKFCAISKYPREELLGQDHRIINSGYHSTEFIRDLWSTIAQGRVWHGEIRNRAKDGSIYWVNTTIVPFLDDLGKPRQYVAVRADITARKRAEEALRELNADLERRVAHRTSELQAANQELESFCYAVSHDLRAPLRGIAGFTRILAENYPNALDETGNGYLRRVLAATGRMSELIDDLLNLSRVNREHFQRQMVDLSALARTIAGELRKTAPGRDVEFVIADGLEAEGDARLLRIMLENLLGNAWKFTSKKPSARIEFCACVDGAGGRVFSVCDNGAGFDMRYAGKLFGPFQRLHGMAEFPGTGIGLATVQRIVHRHGGRIWAQAEMNEGATFSFSL